ncbi:hypothetical protein T440DRAFT_465872 [Plenodomus tracheiphilus IPT5]|uniref:Uncharacterized protein n=1 Tax=Plenodomus tracheiphilus IPT5 TaxID=1408161 RepID=A0A6A7BH93_9PLEO|nr:hypothetical protein T440DRAFT_465872 [Plenodomus tracheiphilus IPT5]
MQSPYITRGVTHVFWHASLSNSYAPRRKRSRLFAEKEAGGVTNGLQVPKEVRRVDSANLRGDESENEQYSEPRPTSSRQEKSIPAEAVIEAPRVEVSDVVVPKIKQVTAERTDFSALLKPAPTQVLKLLFSDAALSLCRPQDEILDVQARGNINTHSHLLSPFEELLCAVVLSRAIPYDVGLRIIRTVLSAPYKFSSSVAIKIAGPEKVKEALRDIRSQQQGRAAEEIDAIVEAISNNSWHNDLGKLRKLSKSSVEAEREVVRRSIKGLGKTGLDIFFRRVQWLWEEAFPSIDERTQALLEKLGLPKRPESLARMIEVRWADLGIEDQESYSNEERRRRAFVMVLERTLGAEVQKNTHIILEEAMKL